MPCIKIVGNIANGNDAQTGYLINLGGIEKLEEQLYRPKKVYRRESCWVLSNITAGPNEHVEAVFYRQNLVAKLLDML